MKKIVTIFILVGAVSCSSTSKVVVTGEKYDPLSPGENVELVLIDDMAGYHEIGIVDIGGMTLDQRVEKAKELARTHGGDTIMPYGVVDEETRKKASAGYQVQSFFILKQKTDKEQKKVAGEEKEVDLDLQENELADVPGKEIAISIANLPRATYKQLLKDYPAMQGKEYFAALYPVKFYKIPSSLKVYDLDNHKLLLMQTSSEKYRLLVFVPEEKIDVIKKSKEKGGKVNFAYSPLGVYKQRYPVLKLIKTQ